MLALSNPLLATSSSVWWVVSRLTGQKHQPHFVGSRVLPSVPDDTLSLAADLDYISSGWDWERFRQQTKTFHQSLDFHTLFTHFSYEIVNNGEPMRSISAPGTVLSSHTIFHGNHLEIQYGHSFLDIVISFKGTQVQSIELEQSGI